MRVLTHAVSLPVRGVAHHGPREPRPVVPRGRRRQLLAVAGFVGGAVLWVLYAWLMLHPTTWALPVVYAGIGACCGLALATISRLMVHFLAKQWSALRLRQYTARLPLLLAEARRQLEDVELTFKPLKLHDWIAIAPPELAGPRYVLEELLDVPEHRLQVTHPVGRKCLSCQERAVRVREHLARLAS